MSTRNSIQVGIKMRPLLMKEKELSSSWNVTGNTICLEGSQNEPYCFDYVFDQEVNNQVIFDKMGKHIIHSTVHGFNGTIFAYGQTASGKTYTMMGGENDPGVMVLAAQEIFNEIDRFSTDSQFLLRGSFIEIYNEKIYDLLNKSNQELKIHEATSGNIHLNCEEKIICNEKQLLEVLEIGNAGRTVSETNMNERSSRSHAIFRLIIESRQADSEEDDKVTQSVLNLVDLAGSERADQTGARGARLKEGGHINKSLLFLSTVIKRLSENEDNKYVNYRDSKLTRILQASLGGNAFASIICTVNPTSVEETQSTLNFAMRAKTIKNKPQVNEIVSDATMMKRLNREIAALKKQLHEQKTSHNVEKIQKLLLQCQLRFVNSSSSTKVNRRRTWCAENVDLPDINSTVVVEPSLPSTNPFSNAPPSRIRPPLTTSFFTTRMPTIDVIEEDQLIAQNEMPEFDETFKPAELFDFGKYPQPPITPAQTITINGNGFQKLSDSPNTLSLAQHCDNLQDQINELTNDKEASEIKIEQYEAELQTLKAKLDKLEIENRNAISLDYEFETHRNKAKQREKELLEVLDDKNLSIVGLEKQLKALQAEKRQREDSCEPNGNNFNNRELVCKKCERLQNMIDERNQVEWEFNLLSKKYEELQINYLQLNVENNNQFTEREKELCDEIESLKEKLVNVDRFHEEFIGDFNQKVERCESLTSEVEIAEKQLRMLQHKYETLEGNWQKQEEAIGAIKSDYNALEKQYNELKSTYDSLECSSSKSTADCARLQSENDGLQDEIHKLKTRIKDMQERLLDDMVVNKKEPEPKENDCPVDQSDDLRFENERLKGENKELEMKYAQLQQEYEQLSTNVMESVYENDKLLDTIANLKDQLKGSEETQREQHHNNDASPRVHSKCVPAKLKDVSDETNDDLEFPYLEQVELIEFKSRAYIPINACLKSKNVTFYKLSLGNWQAEEAEAGTTSDAQIKATIEECKEPHEGYEVITKDRIQYWKETIENLEKRVEMEKANNEAIFVSSQRDVRELREEIKRLTAALLEKSVVLEDLFKERTEISMLNEELQSQIARSSRNNSIDNTSLLNASAQSFINETICQQADAINAIEKAGISLSDAFIAIKNELMQKDEECKRLKLEMLQKLEFAETEFRSHLRKYNQDWEESRRRYKQRIKKLEEILVENGISIESESEAVAVEEKISMERTLKIDDILDENDEEKDMAGLQATDYDESCIAFKRDDKTSTPSTPPSTPRKQMKMAQEARRERSIMVQECNDQITKLQIAMEEAKFVNAQLTDSLADNEALLLEKQLLIESLMSQMEKCEKDSEEFKMASKNVESIKLDLEQKIETLEKLNASRENEIRNLKSELQIIERKASELEERYTRQLKESTESDEMIKTRNTEWEQNFIQCQAELNGQLKLKDELKRELEDWQIKYKNLEAARNNLEGCALELEQQKNVRVELEERLDTVLNQNQILQTELIKSRNSNEEVASQLITFQDKIKVNENLESELERLRQEQKDSQETISRMQKEMNRLEELQGQCSRLQSQLITVKSKYADTEKLFLEEKEGLVKELEACKAERKQFEEKSETFELKVATITKELRESVEQGTALEKAVRNHETTQKELTTVIKKKNELELEIAMLKMELRKAKEDINSKSTNEHNELETLKGQLEQIQAEHSAMTEQKAKLEREVRELRYEVSEAHRTFKYKKHEVESQFKELQFSCASLTEALAAKTQEIELRSAEAQREADEHSRTKEQLCKVQNELKELKSQMEQSAQEAKELNGKLQAQLAEQQEKCIQLHNELLAKERTYGEAKLLMEDKLTKLQTENKDLSERLAIAHDFVKKRVSNVCESANSSMETGNHSQNSSVLRSSPCTTPTMVNVEDKYLSIQKERKNRRLSTYDENRRQSAKFSYSVDASTSTDPDFGYECDDLRTKLKECELQLFISRSRVTALNLELRNHPLKTENVMLCKRIQEEQEKNTKEVKKFKAKITEQSAKIATLVEQAKISANYVPIHIVKRDCSTCMSPGRNALCVETQTDMEIDQSFHKLQGKYNDLKHICRFRYTTIKDLKKKLEEKENIVSCQCAESNQKNPQANTTDKSSRLK